MLNVTEFIGHVPLFDALSRRQKRKLAAQFATRTYQAQHKIVTQGSMGAGMYIIVSGRAEAVRTKQDGQPVTLHTFGPTDFFGELSLLAESNRTASVVATEETQCLVLLRSDFITMMHADADMATMVAQTLARRFHEALNAL